MLIYSDVEKLRANKVKNRDILQTIARVVPSAAKALSDADNDRNTPDDAKEEIFRKMLDATVPKTGVSGLPYANAVGMNSAQKKFDSLQTQYQTQEKMGSSNISHTPGRYAANPQEGMAPSSFLQNAGKIGYNFAKDGWDIVTALLTDPGNVVKNAINPIVGTGQAIVDAAVPGQLFGDTEAKQSAYDLAHSYGLIQTVEGIGHLVRGQGQQGMQSINEGMDQLYTTTYENPLSTYLLGKGVKGALSKTLKGAGNMAQARAGAMTAGEAAVPLESAAARMGQAGSALKGAGEMIEGAGSSTVSQGIRSMTPEMLRQPIDTVGNKTIDTITGAPRMGITAAKAVGRYGTSQISGLTPESMNTIVKNPAKFEQAQQGDISVGTVASNLKTAIETRLDALSENGKLYESVRNSGRQVTLPEGGFQKILDKYGIKMEKGKLVVDPETARMHLEGGDIAALQKFMTDYGREGKASSNRILNARQALDKVAGWGENKTEASTLIARDLRAYVDERAASLPGLKAVDKLYGPERKLLNKVRDDFLHKEMTPDGKTVYMLNDNALRKLYSSTTALNDPMLQRLDQLVPGIGQDLRVIRALKDVELANGQKVGTYVRGAVGGGGLMTGNIPAIAAAIIFSPPILVPLLKWWGKISNKMSTADNILTKVRAGSPLNDAQRAAISDAMRLYEQEAKNAPTNPAVVTEASQTTKTAGGRAKKKSKKMT